MLKDRLMPRKLRGFTLTEAAIVLGIVGLILGAIWVAAAAVYNNMRVSTTNTQLLQMVSNIRSLYATQQSMEAAATQLTLATAGAIPRDMIDDPAAPAVVRNVWNGVVLVAPANVNFAGDAFDVTLPNMPRQACTELLVRTTGSGRDSGLVSITTGVGAIAAAAMPIDVATANAQCVGVANQIVYRFFLKT